MEIIPSNSLWTMPKRRTLLFTPMSKVSRAINFICRSFSVISLKWNAVRSSVSVSDSFVRRILASVGFRTWILVVSSCLSFVPQSSVCRVSPVGLDLLRVHLQGDLSTSIDSNEKVVDLSESSSFVSDRFQCSPTKFSVKMDLLSTETIDDNWTSNRHRRRRRTEGIQSTVNSTESSRRDRLGNAQSERQTLFRCLDDIDDVFNQRRLGWHNIVSQSSQNENQFRHGDDFLWDRTATLVIDIHRRILRTDNSQTFAKQSIDSQSFHPSHCSGTKSSDGLSAQRHFVWSTISPDLRWVDPTTQSLIQYVSLRLFVSSDWICSVLSTLVSERSVIEDCPLFEQRIAEGGDDRRNASISSTRRLSTLDAEAERIFERQQRQERLANIRTTLTLFIVTATFILMYLPSIVIILFDIKPHEFREIFFLLFYINSAVSRQRRFSLFPQSSSSSFSSIRWSIRSSTLTFVMIFVEFMNVKNVNTWLESLDRLTRSDVYLIAIDARVE